MHHLLIEVLLLCKDAFVEVGFLSLKAALIAAKPITDKVTKTHELIVCDIAIVTMYRPMMIVLRA